MRSSVFVLAASLALAVAAMTSPGRADGDFDDHCAGSRNLMLVNGRIHTLDANNSIVSSATIKNGKFVAVGHPGDFDGGPCMRVIDLHGRVAVPGLVDNHNHFLLLGLRPGHDTRLETAASIADVQAAIAARTKTVPAGAWITAMGGWTPAQFAENRLPTLAELDAAAPNNPVLVYNSFLGPAATNTLGKVYFTGLSTPIPVGADGSIGFFGPSLAALNALRAIQTFNDKKQGTLDAMAYSASVGVTTNVDMGGFVIPGVPDVPANTSFEFDTLASWDPYTAYDPLLALHDEGKVSVRVRIYFLSMDLLPDVPLTTARVLNAFSHFGDDMVRSSGIGEFVTNWPLFAPFTPTNYVTALTAVAQRGWAFQQHSLSLAEDHLIADAFETINKTTPIADLRWSDAHVPAIDLLTINRLKAIGAGIAVHGWMYLSGSTAGATPAGPPYRTIVDSGIQVGAGSDSAQISTLNPWNMLYYMTTGRNAVGNLINFGQLLTREEAIRLYTVNNGWFLKEESKLGSIEEGKFGDVVVLNADYFNAAETPDVRKVHPVMTVIDGKVVYSTVGR
jgi:predicted amidohydrolase YtcJ